MAQAETPTSAMIMAAPISPIDPKVSPIKATSSSSANPPEPSDLPPTLASKSTLPTAPEGTTTSCTTFINCSSHHGGQYREDQEDKALLIRFQKTLRDGGWKKPQNSLYGEFHRPSQVRQERSRTKSQVCEMRRLSEPKRKACNYLEELEHLRRTFHPCK